MIKKVFIIWWWNKTDINDDEYRLLESDFLEWNIKNQSYGLMITKAFIDEFWKDNVINCLVRGKWEYKNIFRYKWYRWKYFQLFRELWKNRKESIFMFHGVYPWILIYSFIPAKHKCWRRHWMIWQYKFAESKIKWILFVFIQIFFWRFIDTIFYVNETEKNELMRFWLKWNKFFLPIPINTNYWLSHKIPNKVDNENRKTVRIFCTWNIWSLKNQKIIVEALWLLKNNGINFMFYMAWNVVDTNYKKDIENSAKSFWVKIKFLGFLQADQLKEYYKNIDIYIQPSLREWLCQTYIEAWLSWCPLVLSNIPTFIDTAKSYALFFDPFNAKDLTEKILYMIDHIDEYKEKAKILTKEFEKFGYESFYKQFDEFISKFIEKWN